MHRDPAQLIVIHGLFVDDMMHISSCDELKAEFMKKYSRDFEITGGGLMKTFLGMEVEQDDTGIKLHLDHYIQTVLSEYTEYIKKSLRPKKVPISPGVVLHPDQVPRRSLRQRPSTTQHQWRPLRFYTSASSWTDWDSPRLALLQFMRITQHVLSGATTSSADERGPSTSTSGSTSPTKSSRMERCGLSRSLPRLSWRTS